MLITNDTYADGHLGHYCASYHFESFLAFDRNFGFSGNAAICIFGSAHCHEHSRRRQQNTSSKPESSPKNVVGRLGDQKGTFVSTPGPRYCPPKFCNARSRSFYLAAGAGNNDKRCFFGNFNSKIPYFQPPNFAP